jgi:hypothetical protein
MYKLSNSLIHLSFAVAFYFNFSLASPAPAPEQPAKALTSALAAASTALGSVASQIQNKASGVPFFSPLDGGGSELDVVSPGLGEPMNVIISGLSDPRVLTDDGFLNWAQSVDM